MTSRLGDLALGTLAVLTIVLLVLVVGRQRDVPEEPPADSPTTTAQPTSPDPGEDASDGASDGASEDGPERDAEDQDAEDQEAEDEEAGGASRVADERAGVLAHARTAACRSDGSPAVVEVVASDRPARRQVPGLTTVTGVQVVDDSTLRVVGADAECAAVALRSSDLGQTWQTADLFEFWSLVPDEESGLVHAAGRASAPCVPVAVSGVDVGVARVLCESGRVLGTADAGVTWIPLGDLPGGLAISYATPGLGYALVEDTRCEGPRIRRTTDGGASWSDLDCAEINGPWAITARGEEALVVGGDGQRTRVDGGPSGS